MDNNEKRMIANEIMRQLFDAGDIEQLNILHAYVKACIEELERV